MAKKKLIRWDKHPSVTTVNGKPRLKIFEEYSVEPDLPKFKKLLQEEVEALKQKSADEGPNVIDVGMMPEFSPGPTIHPDGVEPRVSDLQAAKDAKWTRRRYVALKADIFGSARNSVTSKTKESIFSKLKKLFLSTRSSSPKDAEYSVEEAFSLAKESCFSMTTEELVRSRAIASALIDRFESSCQYAMAKKVRDHISIITAKLALAQKGMCTYITEEQAIEFMTKAERGVQVEFLRYYPEILPEDVRQKLIECNRDMLFDNYVVMFYSNNTKPVRLLEEEVDEVERIRRRDPILFGTIRDSRALYYICDWIYKDDDLTISTVEKAIGTLPTLKEETISESQFTIEEMNHSLKVEVERAVQEARDRGFLVPLSTETMAKVGL